MSKFNTATVARPRGSGPVTSEATPSLKTFEGGNAYARDAKSDLFMLAVVNFVGEDTFYESAQDRDARFAALVRQVAVEDGRWLTRFVRWLRTEANMRSAPIVAACEGVHARLAAGIHEGNRALIDASMNRADEPGELVAYWSSRFGRVDRPTELPAGLLPPPSLPTPVKRGLSDAARRLYTEYALLKYDTSSRGVRFGDVIDLVHAHPGSPWRSDLYRHALDRRHNRDRPIPESLGMVRNEAQLRRALEEGRPEALLSTHNLRAAGMTWEDVLPRAKAAGLDPAAIWGALIPTMGIMALARNLRNFDEAGVSGEAAQLVMERFADAEAVAQSRMFPFRWLSAYEAAPSLRWGHALDQALQHSLSALPSFPGRTLVLVDTSSSMSSMDYSRRSTVTPIKAAAVFGVALAARGEAVDLVGFANGHRPFRHGVGRGASVIREVTRFIGRTGEDGHGTQIARSLEKTYDNHDRVIIVTDCQSMDSGIAQRVPDHVPMYAFNLGGYAGAPFALGPNRVELGGLTDATFRMIPLMEAGRRADWPF